MLNNLGERCNKILRFLLHSTDYISMRELAEKTGVSRRSVYYDVCNINDWLDSHNLPPLKIVRGKGIFIPPAERISIDALADKKDDRNEYIFSPGERAKIIACYIIQSKTPVYVEQLMEACLVSRNTIFSDIQLLIRQLHEYNAKLSYAPKTGYKITGDVIHVRALYFLFFDALRILLENGQLSFFNRDEINAYFQRLSAVKAELKVDYVEGNLYSLAALLPIMKDSTDDLNFIGLKREKIFASREFQLVKKHFPELREDEQIYPKIAENTPRLQGMNRHRKLASAIIPLKGGDKMYLTQINMIRGLTKAEYFQLRELCFLSNCLYNVALYNVRQQYFKNKTYLTYFSNCPLCKDNDNYKLLQAQVANQTLRAVDFAFKSFFGSVGKVKSARPPRYRQKGGLFTLIIPAQSVSIKDGYLTVPQSRTYTSVLNNHRIKIKVPERLIGKKIREVKIIPLYKGRAFKIAYCYEIDEQDLKLNRDNSLAIDIGLDNLATCVTNFGTSFIMDGRKIKHINRNWNKRRAYLQSILWKQGRYSSKLLERITLKRNNRVNDCLKKTARYIVNFCIANDIGTVICGYNPDFKRGINLGAKVNQQFTQISFGALRQQLKSLCARYGMNYIEQEESYTSKASFLDLDELPIYNAETPYTGTFSGKRIKRGLYRSKSGRLINADVNGAANILRKSKQNLNFERLCGGLRARPLRIRVA